MAATAASFQILFTRCLDAGGEVLAPFPASASDRESLRRLYRALVRTRTFDAKAVVLQRTGRLGTYASSLGQEAVSVGAASAMRAEDVLVPSFREHGAQLWRGVTPLELFLYWGGDERGSDFAGPREDFPVSVPVGSHAHTRRRRRASVQAAAREAGGVVHFRRWRAALRAMSPRR